MWFSSPLVGGTPPTIVPPTTTPSSIGCSNVHDICCMVGGSVTPIITVLMVVSGCKYAKCYPLPVKKLLVNVCHTVTTWAPLDCIKSNKLDQRKINLVGMMPLHYSWLLHLCAINMGDFGTTFIKNTTKVNKNEKTRRLILSPRILTALLLSPPTTAISIRSSSSMAAWSLVLAL